MRVFAHIFAEELYGYWVAWFRNAPESACCGRSLKDALQRLFQTFAVDEFDCDDFIPLDELSTDGHRQSLIAHRCRVVIPSASLN